MTPRRWILTAISFLFAIGASVYIIRSSWSEEGARVGLPLWGHVACFAAALLELLCRSIKIRLSGAALRIPLDLRTALRASLGGDFGSAITPARSGAEPARWPFRLTWQTDPPWTERVTTCAADSVRLRFS